ncbi:MAG TPA: hypothetical protein VHI52_02035, partial [Verrucomicrobiae bacterium]|nr:hypothetical protein [Verrucomicrobiae bacterium]
MLGGSSLSNCPAVNVLTSMAVGGTNCQLQASVVNIFATASALFAPIGPAPGASLTLAQGSTFQNSGSVQLMDGTQINGGAGPQSQFIILSGSTLSSTNQAFFQGPSTNHLVIDNNGIIRANGGTLHFGDGLDWRASSGSGEFQAASANALVLFTAPFHVDASVTDSFTGPGTNRWLAGATLDGTARVLGNLETLDSISGGGNVQVSNNGTTAGVLSWINGVLSIPQVNVDAGATMLLAGSASGTRQLLGCAVNNAGSCRVLTGGLSFGQSATLNNLSGGLLELDADGAFALASVNGSGSINNAGIFRKLSAGITQFGATGLSTGPDLNNTGLLDLEAGQLHLLGGLSAGEFRTGAGATLWFWGGMHSLNAGAAFTGSGSVRLSQSAGTAGWLVNAPITIAELELGSNGTVDGAGNTSGTPAHFGNLIASDNGRLSGGRFEALSCQLLDRSYLTNCSLNVLGSLALAGTNCSLWGATLTVSGTASAVLEAPGSSPPPVLSLSQGSIFQDNGLVVMRSGAQVVSAAPPQSRVVITPGAILSSTNQATVQGSVTNHLLIDNSGAIRADAGALQLGSGIDWKSTLGPGEFQAAVPSAILLFAGPFQTDSGVTARFTGPGTNRWAAGATLSGTAQIGKVDSVSNAPVPGNLEILDTVVGTGAIQVTGGTGPAGVLTWLNGTLSLAQLSVSQGGTVLIPNVTGMSRHLSGTHVSNSGHCVWLGTVAAGANAIFDNSGGAVLDIQTDTGLSFDGTTPMLALNNAGTFVKSGGSGVTDLAADFKNTGTFELQAGTLNFQGFWVQNVGSTFVDSNAVLGADTVKILGGKLSGTGTINGNVSNSSVLSPGASPGILSIAAGKDFQQTAVGTLTIEIGGHTAGAQYDRLVVGGNATLAGRLQASLVSGFAPKLGDSFEILTCSGQTGAFDSIDPTGIPGTAWVPQYNGTNVLLVLSPRLTLSPLTVSGNSISFSVPTAVGFTYTVQFSDTLNPPNWLTLKSLTGDGTVQTVTDTRTGSQRYYRVAFQ